MSVHRIALPCLSCTCADARPVRSSRVVGDNYCDIPIHARSHDPSSSPDMSTPSVPHSRGMVMICFPMNTIACLTPHTAGRHTTDSSRTCLLYHLHIPPQNPLDILHCMQTPNSGVDVSRRRAPVFRGMTPVKNVHIPLL